MPKEKITENKGETLRESYTLPEVEKNNLEKIKSKFPGIKPTIKKSEIVRVGIYKVNQLKEKEVKKILETNLGRLSVGKKPKAEKETKTEQEFYAEIVVSEKQWNALAEIFPDENGSEGRPKTENRDVINGILHVFRFNTQRRSVPKDFASYATCRRRLGEWLANNLWKQVCTSLIRNASEKESKELERVLLKTWLADIKM